MNVKKELLALILMSIMVSAYPQNYHTLTSSDLVVKIDLDRGGAIGYISQFGSSRNLVNIDDDGRYIQQSYWAGESKDRGDDQAGQWKPHPWNPVQAGDWDNNHVGITYSTSYGTTFYTKCRPKLFDMNNLQCDENTTMEQWTTLDGNTIKVHCKFTVGTIDELYGASMFRLQESAAIYIISFFKNGYYYNGSSPYSSSQISQFAYTEKTDLTGWGPRFPDEDWIAFVDDNGLGVAVYQPNVDVISEGIVGAEDNESWQYGSSYIAPGNYVELKNGSVYEFDYYIIIDNLTNIRSKVIEIYNDSPSSLSTSNLTEDSFLLSWTAPSSGLTYGVYKNDELVGSTSSTSYTVSNLTQGETYEMTVRVKDPTTKVSLTSEILNATCLKPPNTFFNSGFETPQAQDDYFTYSPSVSSSSWVFVGGAGISNLNSGFNREYGTSYQYPIPDGVQIAFLQEDGKMSQAVNFESGRNYSITFKAKKRSDPYSNTNLKVKVGGIEINSYLLSNETEYLEFETNYFQGNGLQNVEFEFIQINTSPNITAALIDDIGINVYINNETLSGTQHIFGKNICINSSYIPSQYHGLVIIPNGAVITFEAQDNVKITKDFKVQSGGTYKIK